MELRNGTRTDKNIESSEEEVETGRE